MDKRSKKDKKEKRDQHEHEHIEESGGDGPVAAWDSLPRRSYTVEDDHDPDDPEMDDTDFID